MYDEIHFGKKTDTKFLIFPSFYRYHIQIAVLRFTLLLQYKLTKVSETVEFFMLMATLGAFSLVTFNVYQQYFLNNILKISLFLENNMMVTFLKQTKTKYSYHSKHTKSLKLESIQLLEIVVYFSTPYQIGNFCLVL